MDRDIVRERERDKERWGWNGIQGGNMNVFKKKIYIVVKRMNESN